jgi:hypothetical protein
MIPQLFALFCFGLVVSFIVFLGISRAREFKTREMTAQAVESTDLDGVVAANLRPVVVKRGS